MDFRIADTFTDSLGRLTAQEQKATKTTAFDLQLDATSNGLSFHKLDRAKDANFWSVRVNADIRIIVHRTAAGILLAYVDHHDDAYKWAEQRKIERHPTTGAMQLVEVRERIEEVEIIRPKAVLAEPVPVAIAAKPSPRLFDNLRKFELMAFGVPEDWVDDVRKATEDTLFEIISHLPQEAQEALLKLAVDEKPEPPQPAPALAAAGAGLPLGQVGGLPSSSAKRAGGTGLLGPDAGFRLGRHRQDHRGAAPGGSPRQIAGGRARAADDLLEGLGECPACKAGKPAGVRALDRPADHGEGDHDGRL